MLQNMKNTAVAHKSVFKKSILLTIKKLTSFLPVGEPWLQLQFAELLHHLHALCDKGTVDNVLDFKRILQCKNAFPDLCFQSLDKNGTRPVILCRSLALKLQKRALEHPNHLVVKVLTTRDMANAEGLRLMEESWKTLSSWFGQFKFAARGSTPYCYSLIKKKVR